MRARNAITLASLEDADACVAPTIWQRYTFPEFLHPKIQVIHEGIVVPPAAEGVNLPLQAARDDQTVTFAARHLEPRLLHRNRQVRVQILGSEEGGYGAPPADGGTWKAAMIEELAGSFDFSRVEFLGAVDRPRYLEALSRSTVHAYLTYPFVLSWSALEAMALECAMVVSDTAPTREFFSDAGQAHTVSFFDHEALAECIIELIGDPERRFEMGQRARQIILDRKLTRKDGQNGWLKLVGSL
jgi:glycosyltransferase involved in cell wall biosynthesis